MAGVLSLVTGCQRQDSSDGRTPVEFWTVGLKPVYNHYVEGLVSSYQQAHPDIRLVWQDYPLEAIVLKLQASIAGGFSPDVVNLNTDFAYLLAEKGALVDMDQAVPADYQSGFFSGLWNAARYQGSNYALPWYVTLQATMYNADLFRQADLDPQRPPRTWEEALADARIIQQKTSYYGFCPNINLLDDFQLYGIPIVSPDRRHALFNTPAAVARLNWYVNLFQQGLVPRDTLTRGYQGALDRFIAGNLGMLFAGPNFLVHIKNDSKAVYDVTKVARLPPYPTGLVSAATMNFVVPTASRHRQQAVDFAMFLTNDDNQLAFCKLTPILPSRIKAAKDPYFSRAGDTLEDQAIRLSLPDLPKARDLSLGLPHDQDLSRIVHETVEAALLGRKSAQQALDDAVAQWNVILASNEP
jgi:putative chitobiose transport system substrate-binding protein